MLPRPPAAAQARPAPVQEGAGGDAAGAQVAVPGTGLALFDGESCGAHGQDPGKVGAAAVRAGMPLVSYKWMLDCIGGQKLLPWQPMCW